MSLRINLLFLLSMLCMVFTLRAAGEYALKPSDRLEVGKSHRAVAEVNKPVNTQDRIRFTLRGSGRAGTVLTLSASIREGGRLTEFTAPPIRADADDALLCDFTVNALFPLSDASYQFEHLSFTLSGPAGAAAGVGSLKIGSPDELTGAENEPVVSSAWTPSAPRRVPGLKPVRIYFEFDNRDLAKTVRNWPGKAYIPDPNPSGGFRSLILEWADGIVEAAAAPAEADVIVYARARKGADPAVAEAVRGGKRLIAYGAAADPEIAALLPLALERNPAPGLLRRDALECAEPDHPVFRGQALLSTDYGRYYRTRLLGGKALLHFSDGEPAVAEKGNIQHWALGLGTAVLPPGSFYDRTFLRAVCAENPAALAALEERNRSDRQARIRQRDVFVKRVAGDAENSARYRPGMSEDNFGRFGWLISDGLFSGAIGRDLTVSNGPQFYRFDDSGKATATLHNWTRRALSGSIRFSRASSAEPTDLWSGEGTVEYTAELPFNPAWQGRELYFAVDKGIDDTDETLFNGTVIGRTGTETPRYWECRRLYRIDPALVRRSETNRFTVRVTNLRDNGGFGSAPYLLAALPGGEDAGELRITGVDWVHKSGVLASGGRKHSFDTTLLAPFVRHELNGSRAFLALEEKTAQYAAWPAAGGIRIVNLAEQPEFHNRERDGRWSAPWLLLFRKNWESGRPLLLVFGRQPEKLTASLNGRFISGIEIDGGSRPVGFVGIGWPWGSTPVNASGWIRRLPPEALAQISLGVNFALNFPIGCDEVFRIDREKRTVEILNRFRYKRTADEWNTPVEAIATLPPLAAFALQQKSYIIGSDPVEEFNCNGEHGPLLGRRGTDVIRYTLPLPPEEDLMPVDVTGESEMHEKLNMYFAGGVRWSRGGRVPQEAFTPEYPEGVKFDPETWTIPLQNWMYKLSSSMQGYLFLDEPNRQKLMSRVRDRLVSPVEQFQYKACYLHRQEPFSGIRYPVHFNHCVYNNTPYAEGIGSPVMHGDCGEGCAVIAWGAQQLSSLFGQQNWVRNNWSFLKYAMRYSMVIDDYAFHASTCREFGGGAYIDMLNAEYAAMLHYAQIARTAEDAELSDELFYRAAKRGIPTLMRFRFLDYVRKAMPKTGLENVAICTGFSEDHLPLLRLPTKNRNFLEANDLFDLSQGFPGVLYRLYDRYCRAEVVRYVNETALPHLQRDGNMLTGYIQPMALYAAEGFPVRSMTEQTLGRCHKSLVDDCPGMKVNYLAGLCLWRDNGRVMLREFRDLVIRESVYDPPSATLTLEFDALPAARLALPVESVTLNGVPAEFSPDEDGARLPTVPGSNRLVVRFRQQK
ncbi:MAG: hypothetical protein HPZ91_17685 [Lentisphaeria bacterium]|nr:hypothetical protein [Lentisphaeria bacterium]